MKEIFAKTKYVLLNVIADKSWMPIEFIEEKFSEGGRCFLRPIGISKKMHEFMLMHCRCSHCKSPLQSLGRCSCGQYVEPDPIEVEFPAILWEAMFEKILSEQRVKEKYKRKSFNRKIKLENAGKYTKKQIDLLFAVQEKCCYYCASSLVDVDSKRNYHIDHYISLENGGRNEIFNLVLACPACNLRKGAQDGDYFARGLSKNLDINQYDKTKKIRIKVRAFKRLKNQKTAE